MERQDYNMSVVDVMSEFEDADSTYILPVNDSTVMTTGATHPYAISVFVVLFALSGVFASTFTLVFAYISDTVRNQDERVSAYGLALATFGLSFTIGPMAGGYLAQSNRQYVFILSLILTVIDLLYIYLILPESKEFSYPVPNSVRSGASLVSEYRVTWNPVTSLKIILFDDFLYKVGQVAFLYYTGLWALISTLSVYAVKHFHLSPERLGELMSVLGLCTMVAEAVLVRIAVPLLGEKTSIKVGLVSFGIQCVVLGFAYEGWHLFVCAGFSLAGNLVYPSLSSLVSGSVEPEAVGEALGAINGIKALTEGFGPLLFGGLMTISEGSPLPGWPYLLVSVLVVAAYKCADGLPDPEIDDYVHELERKNRRRRSARGLGGLAMRAFGSNGECDNEEDESLLSEIESENGEEMSDFAVRSENGDEDLSKLPAASFAKEMDKAKR
jgi:DHA1 family tetracycline resistance protein-like MFS transporter